MAGRDELPERSLEVMAKLFGGGVRGEEKPARELVAEFFELNAAAEILQLGTTD